MSTVIDELIVRLGLDPSDFQKGQKEAQASFQKSKETALATGKDIEDASKKVANNINRMAREVIALFGVIAGSRSLKDLVVGLTEANAELGRFSVNMAESPQTLAAWGMAAQRFGGSAQATTDTIAKMGKALYDLRYNAKPLPDAFFQLQAATGKMIRTDQNPVTFLQEVGKSLAELSKTDSKRAFNIAQELGIDAGTFALIREQGDAIGDYIASVEKTVTPSNKAIEVAQKLQKSWYELAQQVGALVNQLYELAGPAITELLDKMNDWLKANQDWLATEISEKVKQFADWLGKIDWNKVDSGLKSFASAAGDVANSIDNISTAVIALFTLWTGAKFTQALANMRTLAAGAGAGTAAAGAGGTAAQMGFMATLGAWVKTLGLGGAIAAVPNTLSETPGETFEDQVANQAKAKAGLRRFFGLENDNSSHPYLQQDQDTEKQDQDRREASLDAYLQGPEKIEDRTVAERENAPEKAERGEERQDVIRGGEPVKADVTVDVVMPDDDAPVLFEREGGDRREKDDVAVPDKARPASGDDKPVNVNVGFEPDPVLHPSLMNDNLVPVENEETKDSGNDAAAAIDRLSRSSKRTGATDTGAKTGAAKNGDEKEQGSASAQPRIEVIVEKADQALEPERLLHPSLMNDNLSPSSEGGIDPTTTGAINPDTRVDGRPVSRGNPMPVMVTQGGTTGGGFWDTIASWFTGQAPGMQANGMPSDTSSSSGGIVSTVKKALGFGGDEGQTEGEPGWWTADRQQHAYKRLREEAGLSHEGAKGLIARWAHVEASGGPTAVNPSSGAFGIGQWLTKERLDPIRGNTDYDAQLSHAIKELNTTEKASGDALRSAKTSQEGAIGASRYERAEGYNPQTGIDNHTQKTLNAMQGMDDLLSNKMPEHLRGIVSQVNQGAVRNQKINPKLERMLAESVLKVYGEGYKAQVYSGGQPKKGSGLARIGSTRHDDGKAADTYITDPTGKRLQGDDLGPLAQYWLANNQGGVGMEMAGGGIHLDMHKNRARNWRYGKFTKGQRDAVAAGMEGVQPELMGANLSALTNQSVSNDNSKSSTSSSVDTRIGSLHVHTAATDSKGIADKLWDDLYNRIGRTSTAASANSGPM